MRRPAQEVKKPSSGSSQPSGGAAQHRHHHHPQQQHQHSDLHADSASSEFQCKLLFANTLPLGVSDGKLMDVPLDPRDWLVEYHTTSLEAQFKHDVYPTSSLLSMPLAFVDPKSYTPAARRVSDTLMTDDAAGTESSRAQSSRAQSSTERPRAKVPEPAGKRRRRSEDEEEAELGSAEAEKLESPEALANSIEEGFAAANQEDVAKDPSTLRHPTKPGVYAREVTPILPCFAVEGLQLGSLYFDRDPLENLSMSLKQDAAKKKRELGSKALITRVGEGQRILAVVIGDPPAPPVQQEDGRKLVPYGTVRLFKAKKHQETVECPERPTKSERTLALLARPDASNKVASFEYFDVRDIVMLNRISDGRVIRSILGPQGQHKFFVEEQPVPEKIQEDHDEALAALYASAEQR